MKKLLTPLLMLSLLMLACNKTRKNKAKIDIPQTIGTRVNPLYNYERINIEGARGDMLIYGGNKYAAVSGYIPPSVYYGNDAVYFAGGITLENEFFLITKKIKGFVPPIPAYFIFSPAAQYLYLSSGQSVTFVWNVGSGFDNWHDRFVAEGYVDPLQEGDTITIVRVIENSGKKDFDYSDGKTNIVVLKYDAATKTTTVIQDNVKPAVKIPAGERVAVAQDFLYKKDGIYEIGYKIRTGENDGDTVASRRKTVNLKKGY